MAGSTYKLIWWHNTEDHILKSHHIESLGTYYNEETTKFAFIFILLYTTDVLPSFLTTGLHVQLSVASYILAYSKM
jgi:hypothetical protein